MKKGYLYIAVAVVMFTSFEVVLKFIAGQINPVQLTLCRFAIGFVFLLPVALHSLKKRGERLDGGTEGAWLTSRCWVWWVSPCACPSSRWR